ncbi:MAG: radical SAM family heme chaperone HemW [Erysipelotrichaceae bacterium]|nr:radical SAM family heme chaperone HemW [Erysipelotrichaceae bacterium]
MYIYIHIPFCSHICSYCDFPKLLYDKKYINSYLECLKQEIKKRYKEEQVASIYIGGGTPTSLDRNELKHLLDITTIFHKKKKIEFTIESNVESLTKEKIQLLHTYGVNRVSLGVQSFHENTLKELNRHHTKEEVFQVIKNLKQTGISNISIDYIYGVHPNLKEVKEDLETYLQLEIPHISCYSLIIEEGTIFGIKKRKYIDEAIDDKMYHTIEKILKKNHYIHYEISNYAKEGYQSIHNINYWKNGEYYGFGLGTVSFINNTRITNTKSLTKYLENQYHLTKEYENRNIQISNTFMLGLRLVKGINIIEFKKRYQQDIKEITPVKELLKQKKLVLKNNQLFIPSKYLYLSNEIIIKFI